MARPKSEDVTERREKVRELLLVRGFTLTEIAKRLFDAGELPSQDIDAAIRLIRADGKIVREKLTPEDIVALDRPSETAIFIRRMEYVLGHASKEIEKAESVATSRTKQLAADGRTVGREIVTARKVDRSGIRHRWAGTYIQASKAIALVGGVLVDTRRIPDDDHSDQPTGEERAEPFVFIFPNISGSAKDLDELIAMNLERGKVN